MRFSLEDVRRFGEWSGDRNPLHLDEEFARQTYFGRPIVHGALTALEAMSAMAATAADRRITALDIEFRSAAVAGDSYEAEARRDGDDLIVSMHGDGQVVLTVRAGFSAATAAPVATLEGGPTPVATLKGRPTTVTTLKGRPTEGPRDVPASHALEEFERGFEVLGAYPGTAPDSLRWNGVTPLQARVLALCSYVTGMEAPGLKSLFTRITVSFHGDTQNAAELRYSARTVRFDRQFRLLDTGLEVRNESGEIVATALLRSYVPFSPLSVDLDQLAVLAADRARLDGKIALVVGGSRGLGAELAASLALSKCHVYVSSRHDDGAGQELRRALTARGAAVTFLQGDAGDTAWCESALATIRSRHQRLDLLVLNACARPTPLRFGPQASARQAEYVRDNLRLVESPLSVFAELLNQSGGQIACISTSFVADPPAGFGHYVAVKNAAESLVRTVCRESPRTSALVARPPVLQTRWNDTPAGVPGSIPSHWAATHIVNALARESRPGEVTTLSEFPPIEEISRRAAATPPDFVIRLAASFTTDPLLPAMRFWLKELELNAALEVAPYGQVLQSLLDPASPLNAKGRGFNVLLVRISDWLHEFSDEQVGDTPFVSAYLEHTAQDFVSAVRSHRAQASSETLLLLCPSESRQGSSLATLVRDTEARVIEAVRGMSGLEVTTAAQYHPHYGVREDDIHDPLRNEIGHIPFRDEYLFTLATVAVRHAHRRLAPVRKVVVVDCDNTLWRGVVGEVGADGVDVRRRAPCASPFADTTRAKRRARLPLQQERRVRCLARLRHPRRSPAPPRACRRRDDQLAPEVAEHPHARDAAESRARQLRVPRRQPGGMRRSAIGLPGSPHD